MKRWPRNPSALLGVLLQLAIPRPAAAEDGLGVMDGHGPAASPTSQNAVADHADDVADYTLRASLNPTAHTVHGSGTIRWRNTSRGPTGELWLHLYLNAFKNERSTYLRERVGGRGSSSPEDWGWIDVRQLALVEPDGSTEDLLRHLETKRPDDEDETDARLVLPHTVAPGESIVIEIAFDDKLPSVVERTGCVGHFCMIGQWFPKIARLEPDGTWAHFPFHHLAEFYADFGTYDVTLDVPEDFVIGATGPTVEAKMQNRRRVERHVQRDVHDFAWTAWDKWRTLHATVDGVDVRVLHPPGFEAVAARELAALRFALPYEAARYGPYPYSVLTLVHPQEDAREAGGMEYPTLITSEGPWWQPPGVYEPEIVTVHELGHQWFYGLVATNESAWPFLDEGINQFAEVDTMEAWKGAGSALDLFGFRVSDGALQAVAGNRAAHDEPVAQSAFRFSNGTHYGELAYARTASVLDTFARVYGTEQVRSALGLFAHRYRFAHPDPEDLIDVVEGALGKSAAQNLRSALFDKGWVDYAIERVESARAVDAGGVFDEAGKRTTKARVDEDAWEGSVLARHRGTLSFPVDIELELADGAVRRVPWSGEGDWTRIPWRGPVELRGARIDPDSHVRIDEDPLNNSARVEGHRGHALRTFERVFYFAQLALQALWP